MLWVLIVPPKPDRELKELQSTVHRALVPECTRARIGDGSATSLETRLPRSRGSAPHHKIPIAQPLLALPAR